MSPDGDAVVAAFINSANDAPGHIVFILDDYHLIDDPAIHQALTFLLGHQPPTLHFVLAGRADPALPLARYRAPRAVRAARRRSAVCAGGDVGFLESPDGDIDDNRLQAMHRLAQRYTAETGARLTLEATTDRRESLRQADVVIVAALAAGHNRLPEPVVFHPQANRAVAAAVLLKLATPPAICLSVRPSPLRARMRWRRGNCLAL